MRTLVVIAHPSTDSFCHALTDRAVAGLRAAGHDVTVLDLYAEGFRVAMSADERTAYHGDEPILDPMVGLHADAVLAAEALVFV